MFRLATPSFVYPTGRCCNALHLAGMVDEVELLYCEHGELIDPWEIEVLRRLPVDYHIHLPMDLELDSPAAWRRMHAMADMLEVLSPTTYTLHPAAGPEFLAGVRDFASRFPGRVSVENVNGDLEVFWQLEHDDHLCYCLDVGHAVLFGTSVAGFLERWGHKVSHFHLHGVDGDRDHRELRHLDEAVLATVVDFARRHRRVISLEVFGMEPFVNSLQHLRNFCEQNHNPD